MILSDGDIQHAVARAVNPLIIDPPHHPDRLQPASLELTLDHRLQHESLDERGRRVGWDEVHIASHDDAYPMRAGEFILASSVEEVTIPTDMVALVNGKSSWAREGLVIHQTAGLLDPGFRGTVTFELSVVGHGTFWLRPGMAIGQLVFMQMTSPALRPYGSEGLGSHYQGQRGPTPSRG